MMQSFNHQDNVDDPQQDHPAVAICSAYPPAAEQPLAVIFSLMEAAHPESQLFFKPPASSGAWTSLYQHLYP